MSACDLSNPSSPTVEAAATLKRPNSSLHAVGFSTDISVSFRVNRPVSRPEASVTNNFSIRRDFIRFIASCLSAGSSKIAKSSVVIIWLTGVLSSEANLISLFVKIPTTRFFSSMTGNPDTLYFALRSFASFKDWSPFKVIGL